MEGANWLAIATATFIPLVVGFFWYNPKTFGNLWLKSVNKTPEDAQNNQSVLVYVLALFFAVLIALALNHEVNHDLENFKTFKHGAFHGMVMAMLIGLPILGTNALFEGRSLLYILVNMGYWTCCFAIMGGILNVWH